MSVSTQYATATADGSGDAIFMFPDVPVGEIWIGTITIPNAPATAAGTINVGGSPVGPLFGPGIYGPYIADSTRHLSLTIRGLTPDTQYSAVWHADDKGQSFSTWPGTVTTTVEGTVVIPTPVDVAIVSPNPLPVDGTVDVGNTVTTRPTLAPSAPGGASTMTGSPVVLPSHAAVQGVVLSSPSANGNPITLDGGFVMEPGQTTPLLPVTNLDVITATGTGPDVLSWLVT